MKIKIILPLVIAALIVQVRAEDKVVLKDQKDKASYSIGVNIGSSLKHDGVDVNLDTLAGGLKDSFTGAAMQLSAGQQQEALAILQKELAANAPAAGSSAQEGAQLKLKFTAADGSPVDIDALRGHVVLVDFWATWCSPCMREVPDVVATYQKYHDQGFDVIGISLDQDRQAMQSVTQSQGMTWPQYFDGKGWDNDLAASFGIRSIPTMWLVNKKGVLVDMDARGNLEPEVAMLLSE